MVYAHDTEEALTAATWLVNSAGPPDELTTVEALQAFLDDFGYSGRRDGDTAELAAVRAIRPHLRALLLAERDEAVSLVNTTLARATAVPRLVRHDHLDWHIHAIDDESPLAERMQVETAMAMIDVIRADDHSRISVCADETCEGVVLDLSRNRSKKFCSTTCGNRNAVAAYRARQADG
ncbi:MAG: zf-CGNR multi-domain protein [Myxococcales bacterium]|nr:MAG: zf-CGNR multi-domain protein [Myxococcales bacterium]